MNRPVTQTENHDLICLSHRWNAERNLQTIQDHISLGFRVFFNTPSAVSSLGSVIS